MCGILYTYLHIHVHVHVHTLSHSRNGHFTCSFHIYVAVYMYSGLLGSGTVPRPHQLRPLYLLKLPMRSMVLAKAA